MNTGAINFGDPVNRQSPLNRGLVSWWLNTNQRNAGNRFIDFSSKNHGTLTGGAALRSATGRPGGLGAVNFDGVNDYVGIAVISGLANITVSLWTKNNVAPAQYDTLLSQANSSWIRGWGFYYDSTSTVKFWIQTWNANFATATITPTIWNHIVGTWDGATLNIYVNGVVGTPDTYAGAFTLSDPVHLGRAQNDANNINGQMDDVRIYNRAIADREVYALYNDSRQGYPQTLNRLKRRVVHSEAAPAGFKAAWASQRSRILTGASYVS